MLDKSAFYSFNQRVVVVVVCLFAQQRLDGLIRQSPNLATRYPLGMLVYTNVNLSSLFDL